MSDVLHWCRAATLKLVVHTSVLQKCMEAGVMLTGLFFVLESLTSRHAWR
jgi:hypothetical protein